MKIQKIRSISEAVSAGKLRELDFYDGVNDYQVKRWDWFYKGNQMNICVQWPIESIEGHMKAIYYAKRSINKWIKKKRAIIRFMSSDPDKLAGL